MNQVNTSTIACSLLVWLAAVSGCATSHGTSMSTREQDANITADIRKAIAQHPDLGPPNFIYVSTRDRVVYLTGTVDNGLAIANAKDIAGGVTGVAKIVSTISVSK
jgi:osmotically-inducible protein OsmY